MHATNAILHLSHATHTINTISHVTNAANAIWYAINYMVPSVRNGNDGATPGPVYISWQMSAAA